MLRDTLKVFMSQVRCAICLNLFELFANALLLLEAALPPLPVFGCWLMQQCKQHS